MATEKSSAQEFVEGVNRAGGGHPEQRFTGAVSIGSEDGRSIVLATQGGAILMALPHPDSDAARVLTLSEDEAWCLARQIDLACRRARR